VLSALALFVAILAVPLPAAAQGPVQDAPMLLAAVTTPTVSLRDPAAPAAGLVTDLNAMLLEAVFTAHQESTMVRAKFKVVSVTRTEGNRYPHTKADGSIDYSRPEPMELSTLKLSPVSANGDPSHENSKFWAATPSGAIELSVVPSDAVAQFKLGSSMYVDFTPADG
jgi:hypothetical protein